MAAVLRVLAEFIGSILNYTRPYSDALFYYIYLFFMGETKPLPPIDNKILLMSATELAEKIRKRQLKSEDVVRAYVERARAVQPFINAITDARYEEAIEDARKVDLSLENDNKSPEDIEKETPLLGVPFSCKESVGVKGLAQTAGVVSVKTRVANEDSDAASLYRAAGAIPITVTHVPEMCMWWDSSNLNFGICKNPYDNHRTVGGSTGGEAAILTAAGAVIGIGTDIGGSIRMPSSFNGIYGHKPSTGIRNSRFNLLEWKKSMGLVPNVGDNNDKKEQIDKLKHLSCTGPMCRYVNDLPLLVKILSGNDQRLQFQTKVDFHNVKIYYMEEFTGKVSAIPALKKSVRKAVDYFAEQFGTKAVKLRIDEMKDAVYMWECKILETGAPPFKTCFADGKGKVNLWWDLFKSLLRISDHTLPAIFYAMVERKDKDQFYYDCLKKYERVEQKFLEIFKEDAIFLMPTHPELPTYYHLTIPKYLNLGYTAIFNTLGFPATNIPTGLHKGLPMGIQAISGHFKDHLTVAAAVELDKCFGGWKGPSEIRI